MTTNISDLLDLCNEILQPQNFDDHCPNGLQVQGGRPVRKLVSGVTACLDLIKAAIECDADAIVVHHGLFWKGEDPTIRGMRKQRLKLLLDNDISLLAYHLPMDAHPTLGNNAQLARRLGWQIDDPGINDPLLFVGRAAEPMSARHLARDLTSELKRPVLHISANKEKIEKIAWCTGAAQGYIELAVDRGVDAYISGEISEPTVHIARENNIHYFAAGHHATERYGVQALGEELASRLGIEHQFIDIDNPV